MKIHLPTDIQKKLIPALEKAGNQEIGGVLMGEHIAEAEFRIVQKRRMKIHLPTDIPYPCA